MSGDLSIRAELRTYSKGDLTRIAVLATRKQAAAEAAYRRMVRRLLIVGAVAFSAGYGVAALIVLVAAT